MKRISFLWTTVACSIVLAGCGAFSATIPMSQVQSRTLSKKELLEQIPIGTSLSKAESILTKKNFVKVEDPSNLDNAELGTAPKPGGAINEDSHCITYGIDLPHDFFTMQRWYVTLHHKNGLVEDLEVSADGLIGP
jgi:hypothetical protein